MSQIVEILLAEYVEVSQPLDVLFGEFQILQIIDHLFDAGHHGIAARFRYTSEKQIEGGDRIFHPVIEITVPHRQLIEVCEHRQIRLHIPMSLIHIVPLSLAHGCQERIHAVITE